MILCVPCDLLGCRGEHYFAPDTSRRKDPRPSEPEDDPPCLIPSFFARAFITCSLFLCLWGAFFWIQPACSPSDFPIGSIAAPSPPFPLSLGTPCRSLGTPSALRFGFFFLRNLAFFSPLFDISYSSRESVPFDVSLSRFCAQFWHPPLSFSSFTPLDLAFLQASVLERVP